MTDEQVYAGVEKALRKYFGKRGEQVVQDNLTCVKRGYSEMQEMPQEVIHDGNGQHESLRQPQASESAIADMPSRHRARHPNHRGATMATAELPRR